MFKRIVLRLIQVIGMMRYKLLCLLINNWKLELLSAMPRTTLMHLSCSPNFPRASYLGERMLTYEPIVL